MIESKFILNTCKRSPKIKIFIPPNDSVCFGKISLSRECTIARVKELTIDISSSK